MQTNDMTITRFEQIIGAIERAPVDGFDMSVWWNDSIKGHPVGCAIGWAIQQPEVRAQGIRLQPVYSGYPDFGYHQVAYSWWSGYGAVAHFLGISRRDARRLFHPGDHHQRQKQEVLDDLNEYLTQCRTMEQPGQSRRQTQQVMANVRCKLARGLSLTLQLPIFHFGR